MSVIRTLFSIILLKQGPQDVPYSQQLLQLLIVAYVASGVLVMHGTVEPGEALANMVLDVLVIVFYTRLVLRALRKPARFVQTASAMIGVGVLFHLLAWPALAGLEVEQAAANTSMLASLAILLLLSWNLLVVAYIFRHALESGMTHAILLSFALFFLSITLSRLLFGG